MLNYLKQSSQPLEGHTSSRNGGLCTVDSERNNLNAGGGTKIANLRALSNN